jgi:DNA invertase Pin-like site-specific DNA recombinase
LLQRIYRLMAHRVRIGMSGLREQRTCPFRDTGCGVLTLVSGLYRNPFQIDARKSFSFNGAFWPRRLSNKHDTVLATSGAIMQKRAAIYVRVSTDKQTIENQVAALRQIAERRGWEVVEQYSDAGISGAKGRDGRPGLDQMLKDASRRKFDVIMAWAIDRVGRSLIDLLGTIQTLEACGVDLYLDQQSLDTTTPAGKLMFQVCGAFAEFERSMIRQRVHAGLKRAVAQGKTLGRPKVDVALEKRIQAQLRGGKGMRKIARELGVGTGTVQRIRQEMEGPFVGAAA